MNQIISILPTSNVLNIRSINIENYQVKLSTAFNLTVKRWVIDIENITLQKKSYGIILNQGTDLLNASGHLDLQALVLLNTSQIVGLEADVINYGNTLILVYMDLDTYNQYILQGAIVGREVFRVGH